MRLDASPEAVQIVQLQGGKLYVRARRARCCGGPLVFLETSAVPGGREFRRLPAEGFELYLERSLGVPDQLVVEARGRRRRHVHAYWDGCAYVV
jgi:hypothetical protein